MLALAATALASPLSIATIHADAAPVISATNAKEIPDSYIIKFKDHVTQELAAAHHGWVTDRHTALQVQKTELRKRSGFEGMESLFNGLKHTYNIAGGFLGYSGHFDEDVIEEIRRHPDVSHMGVMFPSSTTVLTHYTGRAHREGPRSPHLVLLPRARA